MNIMTENHVQVPKPSIKEKKKFTRQNIQVESFIHKLEMILCKIKKLKADLISTFYNNQALGVFFISKGTMHNDHLWGRTVNDPRGKVDTSHHKCSVLSILSALPRTTQGLWLETISWVSPQTTLLDSHHHSVLTHHP